MKSVSMCPWGEKGWRACAPRTGQRWMGVEMGTVLRVKATMSTARSMGSDGFISTRRFATTSGEGGRVRRGGREDGGRCDL
jgi:hypothetical protein